MMQNNMVITIARQYGSGGRMIGRMVAKELNIQYLDKEIINAAVAESGIHADVLKNNDEKAGNHWGQAFAAGGNQSYFGGGYNINDQIFIAESDVIKKFASGRSCVIIGRCGSYVLRDNVKHLSVFINGDIEDRVKRVKNEYRHSSDPDKKIRDQILKIDKQRSHYHHYYTDEKWMDVEQYDITVNSSRFGLENTAKLIIEAARNRFEV